MLVDSRTNELGLEVAHGTGAHGIEYLHALRCGELVASRRHARVNSGESLRELVKCRGHVLEARAALAQAVAS